MSTMIANHLCCARKLSMTALKGILSRYSKRNGNENRLEGKLNGFKHQSVLFIFVLCYIILNLTQKNTGI